MASRRTMLIKCALGLVGLLFLTELADTEPYYSNGGQARFPRFLLEEARPELFCEVSSLNRTTFDALVNELRRKGILVDGWSVQVGQVEEQVLLFLDIVVNNNSMCQMAVKFRRGLFTVQRYFHAVLNALVELYPCYLDDDTFLMAEDNKMVDETALELNPPHIRTAAEDAEMASRRNRLADKLWAQYQSYLAAHPH
ncbi:uncharacterized protein VP01_79g4 [Puccinia sorghi]|uniref:DUF8040 domain-containing protein n=1 Tax=Puccinia sorghi TaxID=27349 RepID=A0A0L6UAM6_9BASI|nr:uncharacterized protein VP01_79g4 [Puccinia sorghi]